MKIKAKGGGWNPYFAGALTGILAVLSALATTRLLDSTNFLGASTTFVRMAGLLLQIPASERVSAVEYFSSTGIVINWQFMFVLGIFLGSLISSLTDRSFKLESVPPIWKEKRGASPLRRAVWAFFGGAVAMTGARMASGCPSGHGLSGMMQLSVSAFVALVMFFCTGVFVATIFYKGKAK